MVDDPHADVVAILTRAPSAGGKTRLCRDLGLAGDPRLVRALLLDTVENAGDTRYARVLAVTPAAACDEVAGLVPDLRVIPQPDGDLGERMSGVMRALFAWGAHRVALIGSDLPEIDSAVIADAFAQLAHDPGRLVLGPSFDGGYYLMAATRVPPVFSGLEWGSSAVCARTLELARAAGWSVHLLPPMGDVDKSADLRRAVNSGRAPRTAAWAREVRCF
jgi:rSAM/selenodomain-associated transferase 1